MLIYGLLFLLWMAVWQVVKVYVRCDLTTLCWLTSMLMIDRSLVDNPNYYRHFLNSNHDGWIRFGMLYHSTDSRNSLHPPPPVRVNIRLVKGIDTRTTATTYIEAITEPNLIQPYASLPTHSGDHDNIMHSRI